MQIRLVSLRSCEGDAVIRRRVELMFDKIRVLKFRALEEVSRHCVLVSVYDLCLTELLVLNSWSLQLLWRR